MSAKQIVYSEHARGTILAGARILLRALEEPTRQILLNSGLDETEVNVREIRAQGGNIGYDAQAGGITDMIDAGIIDPAEVTRNALLNATWIACLLLLCEALVAEIPDEKMDAIPGGDMGGMYWSDPAFSLEDPIRALSPEAGWQAWTD